MRNDYGPGIVAIACGLCDWKAGASDETGAKLAIEWHMECAHGVVPVAGPSITGIDYLPLADAILEQWVAEDAARDAETDLLWLNALTLEDAAFLMSMQILPT